VSGRIVGLVHERILGSSSRKAVLLCLADHADPDGDMAFPSAGRIAQESELGESTVRAALSWLRKRGLILQTAPAAAHRPTTYRVVLAVLRDLPLLEVYRQEVQEPASRPLAAGAESAPDLQQLDPNRPLREPSQEPPRESTSRRRKTPDVPRPHDPLFDAIAEVCQVDPATAGSSIGKVRGQLLKATPPYTADEVRAFGMWWWAGGYRKRPPRVWDLQEQIGVVRTERPAPEPKGFAAVRAMAKDLEARGGD